MIIMMCSLCFAEEKKDLDIYVSHMEPFVIVGDEPTNVTGFEIDLWDMVGEDLSKRGIVGAWEFIPTNWSGVEENIKNKNADVGLCGFTIRSDRMAWAEFSIPTTNSGLGVMVLKDENKRGFFENIIYRLGVLYNALIGPVIVFGFFILISAHFFWLIAHFRGFNGIDAKYFPGIFDGTFYSVVSSSTVGYGDQTPKKTLGRMATIVLIFCGGIFYCNFTAILSADYTTEIIAGDIQGPEDLKGKTVVTQEGTTSISYLEKIGADIITSGDIATACDQLLLERADAVVYDYPVLLNYVKNNPDKVNLIPVMFDKQYYGFVFPKDSKLTREVNISMLRIYESGKYQTLIDKWF